MEGGVGTIGLNYAMRKKKWVVFLGLVGFSSYGLYKMYNMPSVAGKRRRIMKILGSLCSLAEMVYDSAETVALMSRDLKEFLKSDSDEIPITLRQLSKILRSEEVSGSVIRVSQAMTIGILRGYKESSSKTEIVVADKLNLFDRILDKLMTNTGTGFVSVIVGSFARNLIFGIYSNSSSVQGFGGNGERGPPYSTSSSLESSRWLDLLSDDKCRLLVAECIQTFVGTAVSVYLDKTLDVNFYDDIFSGLTNLKHQKDMKDIMVTLCNGMVETLVKTSHRVLTSSSSGPTLGSSNDSLSIIDHNVVSSLKNKKGFESGVLREGKEMKGCIRRASSTLAVPNNWKFVLHVTGRVTFETVRSIVEFFLSRILEGVRQSADAVRGKVLERGFEVVRYFGSKSCVILTLCLMFFLHMMENTRLLLPAYSN